MLSSALNTTPKREPDMDQIYASQTVSVTELKRAYAAVLREASGTAVAVLNNNKPEAYLVPAEQYERLMERLEDLEDSLRILERAGETGREVSLEELETL